MRNLSLILIHAPANLTICRIQSTNDVWDWGSERTTVWYLQINNSSGLFRSGSQRRHSVTFLVYVMSIFEGMGRRASSSSKHDVTTSSRWARLSWPREHTSSEEEEYSMRRMMMKITSSRVDLNTRKEEAAQRELRKKRELQVVVRASSLNHLYDKNKIKKREMRTRNEGTGGRGGSGSYLWTWHRA